MKQFKTFLTESKAADPDLGIFDVMISTEDEDRDGDILQAGGAMTENYMKNPVVLYAHEYDELPVAKALEVQAIPGRGLRARMQFPEWGVSPKADTVRRLWQGGFLNATSVGFIPMQAQPLQRGMLFERWELLEFSIVPVPANAGALRLALKALETEEPEPPEPLTKNLDPHLKRGRVLSSRNEERIRAAASALAEVLNELGDTPAEDPAPMPEDPMKSAPEPEGETANSTDPSHAVPEETASLGAALTLYMQELEKML